MCGICGVFHGHSDREVNEKILLDMRESMHHRGPDEGGIHIDGNIGIAHRRLSIIDLSTGQQPMGNEDYTVWCVYNGELYNFQHIRSELVRRGHVFRTQSDTEVIIHAYEEWGADCTKEMRGMFAFVVVDLKNRRLFGVRDRIGIKPLYYTLQDDTLYFASEIKALMTVPGMKRELDATALYHYLRIRYVPAPRTMLEGIRKLPPGHSLTYENGKLSIERYWDLADTEAHYQVDGGVNDVEERFEELLEECIRIRLMSEVPLGAFLSGGVDSSIVVAKMSRMNDEPVKTFSVGYENDYGVNEFAYAKMVADAYRTEHHEYKISSRNFFEFLPEFTWYLDEPIGDSACIPLYFLSRYAKKYVTVILSGEGADEILAGYGIYKKMLAIENFRKLPKLIREDVLLGLLSSVFRQGKVRKYLDLSRYPLEGRYKGVSASFSYPEAKALYAARADEETSLDSAFKYYYDRCGGRDTLARIMYVDMNTWLPDDLLMKADKMTMATSQELRVPFLDHKMVEFCYGLSANYKVRKKESKFLLREVGRRLLPSPVIKRSKKGFPVPINQWFKDDLRQVAAESLCGARSKCPELFEKKRIMEVVDEHGRNGKDNSDMIWTLLVFEFWHKGVFTS